MNRQLEIEIMTWNLICSNGVWEKFSKSVGWCFDRYLSSFFHQKKFRLWKKRWNFVTDILREVQNLNEDYRVSGVACLLLVDRSLHNCPQTDHRWTQVTNKVPLRDVVHVDKCHFLVLTFLQTKNIAELILMYMFYFACTTLCIAACNHLSTSSTTALCLDGLGVSELAANVFKVDWPWKRWQIYLLEQEIH